MGGPDIGLGQAQQGFTELYEVSCYSAEDQDIEEVGAVHAPGVAFWSALEGFGDLRHHLQVHGNQQIEPRTVYIQRWYVFGGGGGRGGVLTGFWLQGCFLCWGTRR